jgi:dipeptidyl aminopeptidase/acylaminoacyl peptidase
MHTLRLSRVLILLGFALVGIAQTPAKRPMHHRDYDPWKAISGQVLSRDGKFLAYSLFPEEGDGQIVVRNLATGKEARENAGALPPAPDTQNFEAPAEGAGGGGRGARLGFTADGKFLISTAFAKKADTDQAKKDKKLPSEMPKASLLIFDTSAMTAARVMDVASFQVPENGPSLVAYLKGPKGAGGAATAAAENNDSDFQGRGARGGRGGGGGRGNRNGSDMMVRDLRVQSVKERTFEDVTEYSMSKDGKTLAYTVASKKEETNGAYAVEPGTDQAPVALLAGKGRYSKLTWDFAQKEMAFLSDRDDAGAKPPKYKVYLWDRAASTATAVVSEATAGFRQGYAIFERGPVNFSRDGSRLFLSAAPVGTVAAAEVETPVSTATPGPNEEKVVADLWRWNDDYIQPMQKVRAAQERARSYRAVLHLSDKKFLQLSDPEMIGLTPSDDGRYAIGTDDRALRHMVDYDGTYNDVYLVDTATGSRKLLLPQTRGGGGGGRGGGGVQFSPDAKYLLAFKDKQWWSIRVPDGAATSLTAKTGGVFFNEEHDTPDAPPAYGSAGWTKDGKWALVYDEFDVWAVSPDGSAAKKLTDGRASKLQFRVVRLDVNDEEEERGIDPSKPLLLHAENVETRDTGFYSLASLEKGTPQKLLMGSKSYRALGKAKDGDVVMVTATTFKDQPDIQITDMTFKQMKKVTDANPQQAGILWGSGELIKYRDDDGVELQAAVYKPENFNPQRKYPMMVYIYERLSQNVHTFVRPSPGTNINIAYYVSNGYIVLTPDIVYTTGHPGQSALKCVLPAIEAVVEKGYVNRNAIGIQGHSWGGYQTAYLLTQTNVFHAAEAGAPVVDMISAYNGIRWGTGLPRQFQYEKTQSRIGGTLWEEPLRFIENSPVFQLDRVKTPVLILQNDGDDAVPWYQGIEFFLSLRRLGKEAYLFNYNGEPHGLRRRPDQKDYTVRMQEFFDYLLKDAPKPAWMEKGIPYIEREQEKEKHNAVYGEDAKK